jgi:REP element-mobilizing transposase RayT
MTSAVSSQLSALSNSGRPSRAPDVAPASRPAVTRTFPSAFAQPGVESPHDSRIFPRTTPRSGAPRYGEVHIRNRGRLPHWEKEEGLYFITFHLADSLPRTALAKIAERRHILLSAKQKNANLLPEQKALLAAYSHARMEEYFDLGAGSCPFLDMRIAGTMAAALRFREGTHYRLLAWCVMPNHVHVVVKLFPGRELAAVVKAWKNFSAKAANQALGRKGRFWQREYYDHMIRNEGELDRAIRYILENPSKAGLKNWTWVWSAGWEARATAGREAGATSS